MTFKYDKNNLTIEFKDAEKKDMKGKKEKFTNRIQYCKDHIELKEKHPEYYEDVKINFDSLLTAYSSPSPIDHFYKTVFGMTYSEKMAEQEADKLVSI